VAKVTDITTMFIVWIRVSFCERSAFRIICVVHQNDN